MIAAVTGYIGTGKTTTSELFKKHGFSIVDVDGLGHILYTQPELRERLRAEFGMGVLDRSLNIDRKKLSRAVFTDTSKLAALNRIMHPYLRQAIKSAIGRVRGNAVVDVALFQELEVDRYAERVILVTADVDLVYKRLVGRYSKREIVNIMNTQKIVRKPDFLIENNGTVEDLSRRVEQIIPRL